MISRLDSQDPDFSQKLDALLAWDSVSDHKVAQIVDEIIADVKARGDAAVVEYTNRFDRRSAGSMAEFVITAETMSAALAAITPSSAQPWKRRPAGCGPTTSISARTPGSTPRPTVPYWDRKSRPWSA